MMTDAEYTKFLTQYMEVVMRIKDKASQLHESVNQTYGNDLPYGYHLNMVANIVIQHASKVCQSERDVLPVIFAAYFHDSIEDARLTYNDVKGIARKDFGFNEEQAFLAAEIVYALTNDKGRTRAERAGERYYKGIRETPYAPFVKMADRLANMTFSARTDNDMNNRMQLIYQSEMPHFLEAITSDNDDPRFQIPEGMKEYTSCID